MGIEAGIQGRELYLDTNIFIYAFEAFPTYLQPIHALFEAIDKGEYTAFTSELTLAELLVKPLTDNNQELVESYLDCLQASSNLTLIPVSKNVLITAAKFRSKHGPSVKLPDAIHLASALIHGCTAFISNDKRLTSLKDIAIITLADLKMTEAFSGLQG